MFFLFQTSSADPSDLLYVWCCKETENWEGRCLIFDELKKQVGGKKVGIQKTYHIQPNLQYISPAADTYTCEGGLPSLKPPAKMPWNFALSQKEKSLPTTIFYGSC